MVMGLAYIGELQGNVTGTLMQPGGLHLVNRYEGSNHTKIILKTHIKHWNHWSQAWR